jgi:hypothetical protein
VEVNSVIDEGSTLPDQFTDRSTDLDRFDFSATLGYQISDGLSVFSGYRYSEFKLYGNEYNYLLNNKDQKYSEEGLFIGGSYSWQFGAIGALSLSLGYAYLEADFSEDNVDLTDAPPPGTLTFGEVAFDGTAKGLSYGAQWVGPLTDEWAYKAGLKYQSYKANNNSTTVQTFLPGFTNSPTELTDIDTKHSDLAFTVGIVYVFQ